VTIKPNQILLFLFTLIFCSFATAQQGNSPPFQDLQNQINELQLQIEELQQAGGPIEVTVDCNNDSITNVLNTYANNSEYLTITVQGMCVENVEITRSKVLLKGDISDGTDSIKISDINGTALRVSGANEVIFQDLEVKGNVDPASVPDSGGITCRSNASVQLLRVKVTGFGTGISAGGGGMCEILDSEITDNLFGAIAFSHGTFFISNSQIDKYNIGIWSLRNSHISIVDSSVSAGIIPVPGSIGMWSRLGGSINSARTTNQNNDVGARIDNLGIFRLNQGTISNNLADSIFCRGVFDLRGVGGVTFTNNGFPDPGNECPQFQEFP
jgi:uncharacterized Zn ribbon protein